MSNHPFLQAMINDGLVPSEHGTPISPADSQGASRAAGASDGGTSSSHKPPSQNIEVNRELGIGMAQHYLASKKHHAHGKSFLDDPLFFMLFIVSACVSAVVFVNWMTGWGW